VTDTHLSSLVVHVRPERLAEIRSVVLDAGAEIPAEDPSGKIVAVMETADETAITRFAEELALRDGVVAANLVFHLIDDSASADAPTS